MGVCENFYRKLWLRSPDNVSPNNKSKQRNNPRASGKMSKQQTRGQVLAMYTPHRIQCPSQPPEVQDTVRGTKTVQFLVAIPAVQPSAGTPVTVADVMGSVPGGLTYWAHARVNLIRAWAPAIVYTGSGQPTGDSVVLRVDVANDGLDAPTVSWSDSGTGGSQRPKVAYMLGLREQSSWFGVASTQELCRLHVAGAAGSQLNVIVQANLELLSPNLS